MPVLLFILAICVIIEITAIAFYAIFRKRYTLILNTETMRITNLRRGFYEIKGNICILTEKLLSPLSHAPCVYYKFKVEEQRSSGKNSSWHSLIKDEQFVQFGVQDASGSAIIDMTGAKLIFNELPRSRANEVSK